MGLKPRSTRIRNKTQPTDMPPSTFISGLDNERRRRESETLMEMMREVTGHEPVMWGRSIVGFGSYHYKHGRGRESAWPRTGFAPRKVAITIYYCLPGFPKLHGLLKQLGPHRAGVSCLYISKLENVDLDVLRQIVERSLELLAERYPEG
jgi:hypothetical protein